MAHVRARFAVDPSTPARLADAWTAPTGTTEEDEAEFVDAMADCLSVGLPLEAALASWRSGTLEVTSAEDENDENDENDEVDDGLGGETTGVYDPRHQGSRRRVVET
ncbi:MAG TPA: hypothetical protein VGK52_17895 [Polyangia bacterium]